MTWRTLSDAELRQCLELANRKVPCTDTETARNLANTMTLRREDEDMAVEITRMVGE